MSKLKAFNQYKTILPLIITLIFFTAWAIASYISKPPVWDEIVSMSNFVLVKWTSTVTEYPDVNNHIFFNLINNFYCKALSIGDLYEAMDRIAQVRLLPFFLSVISLIYTWLIGRRFFNAQIAGMAVVILVTTLPFLNFTMQLRGYTLSASLLAAATFHLLSFRKNPSASHGIASLIFLSAMLYTIPSNVFFALSLGLLFFFIWLLNGLGRRKEGLTFSEQWIKNRYFVTLVIIGASAAIAYAAYFPIIDDILNERHLQQMKGQSFYAYNVNDLFPKVVYYLTSFKFLLALSFLIGAVSLFRFAQKYGWKNRLQFHSLFLLLLFLLPFAISFARGDKTPQRSFVPLAIPFAILAAISLYTVFRELKLARKFPLVLFGLVMAYCLFSLQWSISNKNKVLHKAILDSEKMNSMMYNFYQSEDYGMEYLDPLIEQAKSTKYPIVMAREIDRVSEGEYLQKNELKYYSTVWSKQVAAENEAGFQYNVLLEISQGRGQRPGYNRIGFPPSIQKDAGKFIPMFYYLIQNGVIDKNDPKCYVLTFAPRWFEKVMKENLAQFSYRRLSPKLSYHNVYEVELKKP